MSDIKNNVGDIIMSMNINKEQIGYDINEKDIDGLIRFLKINDPENATPETAIAFFTSLKINYRENNAIDFGDSLIDLYKEFKKNL